MACSKVLDRDSDRICKKLHCKIETIYWLKVSLHGIVLTVFSWSYLRNSPVVSDIDGCNSLGRVSVLQCMFQKYWICLHEEFTLISKPLKHWKLCRSNYISQSLTFLH